MGGLRHFWGSSPTGGAIRGPSLERSSSSRGPLTLLSLGSYSFVLNLFLIMVKYTYDRISVLTMAKCVVQKC